MACSVFFQWSIFLIFFSDQYLMEFLEDGGVLTLLDILSHTQSKEQDKAEALRLLLTVSNAGRKYKEIICESHGKFHNKEYLFYHTVQYPYCTQ